jgi:N-carbamoyl-L-amino-acid hydrolase
VVLSVERHALAANKDAGGVDTVATIGTVAVHPGAVNSVPSRVTLMLDLRDTEVARRDGVLQAIRRDIEEISARRKVRIAEECINADEPARSALPIVETIEAVCKAESATCRRMVSRAYHDSSFMAQIAPIAMIFVPCRGGVSHRPDEYATPEAIALGTRVLAHSLARLASE